MDTLNLSVVGLTIQCAGIILITSLSFFMTRSLRRAFLDYWTAAWVCLSVALVSLAVAFRVPQYDKFYFTIYFFGEYAFGVLFIAGCHNYATGRVLVWRHMSWLAAGAVIASGLAHLLPDFNVAFVPHAAILTVLFALAFRKLQPARRKQLTGPGMSVMNIALALLTLDFLHYVPVMSYVVFWHGELYINYLQYTSVYDLIFETLLGFGSLMVAMDSARHEVEAANRELRAAHAQLERLARMDPLTEALNRHAFYSLVDRREGGLPAQAGCAVILDIDNLKPINDSLGHAAGDATIRAVAHTLRSVIRADDLLFRWGGDEFLILFFNFTEAQARQRLREIEAELTQVEIPGCRSVIVSHGLAAFAATNEIEYAIEAADSAMYARKQARKTGQLVG